MAHPRDVRIAELKAQIESAKAEIKQLQADDQVEKAEDETGNAMNESKSIALQSAIEIGIVNIIEQGIEKGFWSYRE